MKTRLFPAVALASALALSGCASLLMEATGGATTGRKIDAAKIEQVKKGTTTKAQVLDLFGKPTGKSTGAGGERWTYEYGHVSMFSGQELQLLIVEFTGDLVQSVQFTEQGE